MVKLHLAAVLVLACLLLAAPVQAEPLAPPRAGLGLGLSTEDPFRSLAIAVEWDKSMVLFASPMVYFPINVTPVFRLEPALGFAHRSRVETDTKKDGSGTETNTASTSVFTMALGAYYTSTPLDSVAIYAGPRFAYISSSRSFEYKSKATTIRTDQTGVGAAGVFGAEYYPARRFAVGVEVAMEYWSFSEPSATITPEEPVEPATSTHTESDWLMRPAGMLFARVFFL